MSFKAATFRKFLTFGKLFHDEKDNLLCTHKEQDSTLAKIYHQIGGFHKDKDKNVKEALLFFEKALDLRKRVLSPQHKDLSRSFYMTAVCQESQGDYITALTNAKEAYSIANQIQDSIVLRAACTLLGTSSGHCGDNESAKSYLSEAINLWKKQNDSLELAKTENHIGIIYIKQQRYDSATQHINIAIDLIDKSLKNSLNEKKYYTYLGEYYTNQSIAYRL